VQAGVQLVIWLRVTISEFNSSSDYAAIGTVNVAPVCAWGRRITAGTLWEGADPPRTAGRGSTTV